MYVNPPPDFKSVLAGIPDGEAGVQATLRVMRTMVRSYKKIPQLRDAANQILLAARVPQKAFLREVATLHEYVRDHIRYVRDIRDVETVQTPDITLRVGYGDCDDKATLLATLLESTGHPSRFVAVGMRHGVFSHVYVETRVGHKWIALDPTEPRPAGWAPANVADRLVVYN